MANNQRVMTEEAKDIFPRTQGETKIPARYSTRRKSPSRFGLSMLP